MFSVLFVATIDFAPPSPKMPLVALSQAYLDWREWFILTPRSGMFPCPHCSDHESGGRFVDGVYCKSFSQGGGCRFIKSCKNYKGVDING